MSTSANIDINGTKRRNIIILLGGPGAGKGTQAKAITGWLKVPHISTGQLLRSQVADKTPLGLRVKDLIEAGSLIHDELVNDLVSERIKEEDCKYGFVLDGYPRNSCQAVAFESSLRFSDRQIVIDITIDLDKIMPRLTERRSCPSCAAIYHLTTSPPEHAGLCDECGDTLIQRSDDREDVIRERFKAYVDSTERLVEFYRRMGIYHRVDGMCEPDQIAKDIRGLLEREMCTPIRSLAVE